METRTGFSSCEEYLDTKQIFPSNEVRNLISKILRADPNSQGANCEWLVDSFLNKQFILDEDEDRVKEDILKFKELYGDRRPLPKKGYSELKIMIRQKEEKEKKKSVSKIQPMITPVEINDCKSFYLYVKNSLPQPYNHYSKTQSNKLFDKIQDANPTNNYKVCMWIVEEVKRGFIKENELSEVKQNIQNYFENTKFSLLPNIYNKIFLNPLSNYQIVKDVNDKSIELLYTGPLGLLLIPKTTKTACYYGVETKWCTARKDEKNMFDYYDEKGNIYIWFDKMKKNKFQFHFNEVQFKDIDDNDISPKQFKEFQKHTILGPIFKREIKRFVDSIEKKPIDQITKEEDELLEELFNFTDW
jgi:hypothetical protein